VVPEAVEPAETVKAEEQAAPAPESAPTTTAAGSTLTLVDVRRLWPDIVEATKQRRRLTWIYLTQQAQVVGVDEKTLTLGFTNAGARDSFDSGGSGEIVRQAAIDVVGHDWRVETIVDPGADPEAATPPAEPTPAAAPPAQTAGHQLGSAPTPEPGTAGPPAWATPDAEAGEAAESGESSAPESPSASARQAIAPTRGQADEEQAEQAEPDGGARHDDTDAESAGLDGAALLEEALGAQVIDEIPHQ
jgi:DNA polymerase-3 subunit gamma/tau